MQEGALKLLHNDFASDYAELLKNQVNGNKTSTMPSTGNIKTVNDLNPYYVKEIFSKTTSSDT